jgi:hypothetical protein
MENSEVPHEIRLIRAFGMPPLKRGHRHVAGKNSVIENGAEPRVVENVQQVSSGANLYRHFIDGCCKVARPLMALTAFNWAEAARSALVTSKHLLPWRQFWCTPTQKSRRWERPTQAISRLARFYDGKFRRPRGSIRWLITCGNSSQPK